MSLQHHPGYKLRIGATQLSSAAGSPLLAVQLQHGKCGGAGEVQITLGAGHGLKVALEDAVELELGWGKDSQRVFTGLKPTGPSSPRWATLGAPQLEAQGVLARAPCVGGPAPAKSGTLRGCSR